MLANVVLNRSDPALDELDHRGVDFRRLRGAQEVVPVCILTMLASVMLGHAYAFADQQIVYGVLILLAVFASARDRRLVDQI